MTNQVEPGLEPKSKKKTSLSFGFRFYSESNFDAIQKRRKKEIEREWGKGEDNPMTRQKETKGKERDKATKNKAAEPRLGKK